MSPSNDRPPTETPSPSHLQPPTFLTPDAVSERSLRTSPTSFHFSNIGGVSTAPTLYSDSVPGSRKSGRSDEETEAAPTICIVSESASAEEKVGQWLSAGDDQAAQSAFKVVIQQLTTTEQGSDHTPTNVLAADNELKSAASLIGVGQVLQSPAELIEGIVPFNGTAVPQQEFSEVHVLASVVINNDGLHVPVAALFSLFLALTFTGIAVCFPVHTCAIDTRCFSCHLQELVTFAGPPVLEVIDAACALVFAFRVYELVLLLASVLAIILLWVSLWILQWIAKAAGHDLHLVLPLMIAGKEVEVIVDDGGLNLMRIQDAVTLGLEPTQSEMTLMDAWGDGFVSPGEVSAAVGFPGELRTEALTFLVVDVPISSVTVNKAFRDRHGLQDPLHPHYRRRAYTARELLRYLLAVVSVVDPHLHNVRDFLKVDLPLACDDVEPVKALLDSGSAVDAFSLGFITKHLPKGKLRKCSKYVKCANGDRKHANQKMEVSFKVNGQPITREFYIFPRLKVDMILGGPFRVAHRPHSRMSDQIVSEELRLAGPYPAAAYHFSMEHAGAITSLLLRGWRHLKKQPTPPASAAIQSELDRARKAECELHGANSARISDIDDNDVRSAERATERTRHLEVLGKTEVLSDRLHAALASENGSLLVPTASSNPVSQGPGGGVAVVTAPVIHPSNSLAINSPTGPVISAAVPLAATPAQRPVPTGAAPTSVSVTAEHTEVPKVDSAAVRDVSDPKAGESNSLHTPEEPTTTQLTPATERSITASVRESDETNAHPVVISEPAHQLESVAGSLSERGYLTTGLVPASSEDAASMMNTPPPSHRSGSDTLPPTEHGVDSENGNLTTLATNGNIPTPEAGRITTTPGDVPPTRNQNGIAFSHRETTCDHDSSTNGFLKQALPQ